MHVVYRHICRQKTHTSENESLKKKEKKEGGKNKKENEIKAILSGFLDHVFDLHVFVGWEVGGGETCKLLFPIRIKHKDTKDMKSENYKALLTERN